MTRSCIKNNIKSAPDKKHPSTQSTDDALFTGILDSIPDGIDVTDKNYNIRYVNKVLQQRLGQFQGKKYYHYFYNRKKPSLWRAHLGGVQYQKRINLLIYLAAK